MHEILTIQSGTRANYVATHFWNTQLAYQTYTTDSDRPVQSPVDHDIHFRQGISADGSETYLPRTLIYDLKPAFGSLARVNALDALLDDPGESELWNGSARKISTSFDVPQPGPYALSLESGQTVRPTKETIKYFADFATAFYHPRSLAPLNPPYPSASVAASASGSTSGQDEDGVMPQFSLFQHGASLFSTLDAEIEVLDSHVRPWMEEADAPQGIQLFTASKDAWGGFSARYMERLRDEFPKLSVWVWGVDGKNAGSARPGQGKTRLREQTSNAALTLSEMTTLASLYVPMAIPSQLPEDVRLEKGVLWSESALQLSGIESALLSIRLQRNEYRVPILGDLEDVLCDGGRRRVAGLKLGVEGRPAEEAERKDTRLRGSQSATRKEDEVDEEVEERLNADLKINFFPSEISIPSEGRPLGRKNRTFARVDAFRDDRAKFQRRRANESARWRDGPVVEEYDANPSFPLLDTFPSLFQHSKGVNSIPVHTSLSTSSSIATWIRTVRRHISRGVGLPGELIGEEREALSSGLADIADTYIEGWESGSEDEDE